MPTAASQFEVVNLPGKGRAVISLVQFKPGDLVMEIHGQVITKRGYGSFYCMVLNHGWVLEPYSPGGLANHSCDPNCELIIVSDLTCGLEALVNIEPGQELTYDYGWVLDDFETEDIQRCRCGTLKCRGYILCEQDIERFKRRLAARKRRRTTRK